MRKSRDFYESNFYHIMVQGDEKKYIFNDYNHKKKYLFLMKQNAIRNDIKIISYLMILLTFPNINVKKEHIKISRGFILKF